MIDAHAHIHDSQFDADREAVLLRAREAGVSRIITVGTSISESADAIAMAKKHENIFATVAVHPHEFNKELEMGNKELSEIIQSLKTILIENEEKVVAIGECGLDYHAFDGVDVTEKQREFQKAGFRGHLELARSAGKPVVIHARESYDAVLEIIREYVASLPAIILHCYQGDLDMTQKFLDLDERIIFSFAGNITYPVKTLRIGTKNDIRESIKIIPLNRILTETDCPYLAPQTFRGTRNEPAYITEVVQAIATIKEVPFEKVEHATEENVKKCFPEMFR